MVNFNNLYFELREKLRFNPFVSHALYFGQSLVHANFGSFRRQVSLAASRAGQPRGVALCCRIRDEARYLEEWIEYYLAAGIEHFFFYEKLSKDNFRHVLNPYIERGIVTLFDNWPNVPVSPSAEQDCILRSVGRFEWVGFLDADEFVVTGDGRSIGEFLSSFRKRPAVALHWYMFGSNGHQSRPPGPVIAEYTRRGAESNQHVKCFVRPEGVTKYRNPHSWYYRWMRYAVTETGRKVAGSSALPPSAALAWINHYHHKSDQDYFEKAARKSVSDAVTIRFETRSMDRHLGSQKHDNTVFDDCAIQFYLRRCQALSRTPVLLVHSHEVSQSA